MYAVSAGEQILYMRSHDDAIGSTDRRIEKGEGRGILLRSQTSARFTGRIDPKNSSDAGNLSSDDHVHRRSSPGLPIRRVAARALDARETGGNQYINYAGI